MGGITKNQVIGCSGHDDPYWEEERALISEAFAHMFECQFDKKRYTEMKQMFPNALDWFESLLKGGVQ